MFVLFLFKNVVQFFVSRLGVLQFFISFGSIIGSLLSPLVYYKSSTYAFALSSLSTIAGLLYTSIFLKETVVIKEVYNYYFTP